MEAVASATMEEHGEGSLRRMASAALKSMSDFKVMVAR